MATFPRTLNERCSVAAACLGLLATGVQLPAWSAGTATTPTEPAVTVAARRERTSASRQEKTGVGSGLVIGAAAGGPVGAVIGAAAGAWLGDRMHRTARARDAANERLALHGQRLVGLRYDALFRTEQAEPRAEDEAALRQLAELLRDRPELSVRISGYADPRGSAAYNEALSARRAATVAAVLVAAGLEPGRMQIQSFGASLANGAPAGEAGAPGPDLDGYAFERRVTVTVESSGPEAATSPAEPKRDATEATTRDEATTVAHAG